MSFVPFSPIVLLLVFDFSLSVHASLSASTGCTTCCAAPQQQLPEDCLADENAGQILVSQDDYELRRQGAGGAEPGEVETTPEKVLTAGGASGDGVLVEQQPATATPAAVTTAINGEEGAPTGLASMEAAPPVREVGVSVAAVASGEAAPSGAPGEIEGPPRVVSSDEIEARPAAPQVR